MTAPTSTRLDPRFSEPDATATTWDDAVAVLRSAGVSWLTTVRADGRPHVTPLVAVWLDGAVHFCTGPEEQKARNLAANPHVVLTTGCNRWDDGSTSSSRAGRSGRPTRRPWPGSPTRGGPRGTGAGTSRSETAPSTTPTAARPTSGRSPRRRCSPSARAPSATR